MNIKGVLILFVVAGVFMIGLGDAAVIFSDGFESGGMSGWTLTKDALAESYWYASTTNPFTGSYHAEVNPGSTNEPASTMQKIISTSDYQNIILNYSRRLIGLDIADEFQVEWFDGLTWTILEQTGDSAGNDAAYVSKQFSLPSGANNNVNFAIRFECTASGTEYCRADDIKITGDTVDTTPPIVNITYPLNKTYNANISQLNYTIAETNPGRCWYSVDNGESNFSSAAAGENWTGLNSAEGSNIWRVWCNDTNGNLGTAGVTFFKDSIFPLIDYGIGVEEDGANFSRNWIFVNVSVVELNEANITFRLFDENGIVNESVFTNGRREINWTNLDEGVYYYNVSVSDIAGNINSTATRELRIDRTGPSVNIIFPESKTYGYNVSLPLNYSANDLSGVGSCWYNLDGELNNSIFDCQNITFNTSEGSHTVYVYANDSLGNENYASRNFSVNTQLAVSLESPSDNKWLGYKNAELNYSVSTASQVSNCSLWINSGGAWHLNQTNSSAVNSTGGLNKFNIELEDGSYIWNVFCTGTYSAFASSNFSLNIDSQTPVLNVEYPSNNSVFRQNVSIGLNFTSTDMNLQACWYSLNNGETNRSVSNCAGGFNNLTFGYSNGIYNLSVYVNDSANNINSFRIYNLTIEHDSAAPNLVLSEPLGAKTSNSGIPLQFSAGDNVDSLTEMTCWFDVRYSSTGGFVSGLENVSAAGCTSTTFSVPSDSAYNLFLYSRDRTGNLNSTNSSFSVSTPSGGGEIGGGSTGGGGGGGGGGTTTSVANKTTRAIRIEFSEIDEVVLRRGTSEKINLAVTSKDFEFLNNCGLRFKGAIASWLGNSQSKGLSNGEKYTYNIDLNIPATAEPGSYSGEIVLKCDEGEEGTSLKITTYRENFEAEILEYERFDEELRVTYSLVENSGENHDILINYSMSDFDSIVRTAGQESISLGAKEKAENVLVFKLPKDSFGEFNFAMVLSDGVSTVSTEETLFLPSGSVGGFAVFEGGNKTLSWIGVGVVLIIMLIFVGRFIWRHNQRSKHVWELKGRRGKRKLLDFDL